MIELISKNTLWQDRYQALILPVPTSGVLRHRALLKSQALYPSHASRYRTACQRGELALGGVLVHDVERDLAGVGVSPALSKPKFIVDVAVTEFAENAPHLSAIEQALATFAPTLYDWARYDGMRRVALLANDALMLPANTTFDDTILPLLEKYLQPTRTLNLWVYR